MLPNERKALGALRRRALAKPFGMTPWCTAEAFIPLDSPAYLEQSGGVEVELDANLETVRDFLARQLKPERKLVNAVLFKDGSIVEAAFNENAGQEPSETRVLASGGEAPPSPAPTPAEPAQEPQRGATVAAPVRGCPAPNFSPAEIRATHVLSRFLTPDQMNDFRRYNRFVSLGATTGHRYMLTSRFRRDQLDQYGGRSLYDLDEECAYCVHDWDVPAAEELLGLHLFLQLPGKEAFLREISE